MAKKQLPEVSSEEAELIKKIDQMMDLKYMPAEVKVPKSIADMALSPAGVNAKEVKGKPAEPLKPAHQEAALKITQPKASVVKDIDSPNLDQAVHEIEVAEADRLLEADMPEPDQTIDLDQPSSISQWLWLIGVIGAIVLAVLYLLLLPARTVH